MLTLALLHLDPNSPEAQVFYQFGKTSNHAASSPAPSPTGNMLLIDYMVKFKVNWYT